MKKILLSAAAFAMVAVSAIAVAPTTAQAIPAFARQTGAACYSCHFQSFPALTDFGRSFKRDAFTDVGEEALVEDDNLSIPAVLNASLVLHANYTNTDTGVAAGAPGYSKGAWNLPSEAPLLIAGRVGKSVGAFGEFGGGTGAANGSSVNNWQVMSSFDLGNFKMGLNVFNTGFGWTAGIETSNVFGQHSGVLNGGDVAAVDNVGMMDYNTQGATLWAGNDLWFVGLSGISPDVSALSATQPAPNGFQNVGFHLAPAIRAMITPQLMGWDTMLGFGLINGNVGASNAAVHAAGADMWFVDAQAQGELGNASIGLYADYAHTKNKSGVSYQMFGAQVNNAVGLAAGTAGDKTDGFSIRATVKPIPQWVFEVGYGYTKYKPATAGQVSGKNTIWQIGGQYELYQNMNLKLMYADQKVDAAWGTGVAGAATKTKTTTVELEALM